MSTGHLIKRPIQIQPCSHCGNKLLVAIDLGLTIYADPAPLTIHAEIAAILTRRATYNVVPENRRKAYLLFRDTFRIAADRNGRRYTVVAMHACPAGRQPDMGWHPPRPEAPKPASKPSIIKDNGKVPF